MGNQYSNGYCTVEDDNKVQYILTDKNKQPLYCFSNNEPSGETTPGTLYKGTCKVDNFKKYLDNPDLLKGETFNENFIINKLSENHSIPCSSPYPRPAIFGPTNTNTDNSLPNIALPIPKTNINFNNYDIALFVKDAKKEKIDLQKDLIDILKVSNNNVQNSLIRDDARKIDPNAPPPAPEPTPLDYKLIAIFGLIGFILLLAVLSIILS
jgi:hypothetical protein